MKCSISCLVSLRIIICRRSFRLPCRFCLLRKTNLLGMTVEDVYLFGRTADQVELFSAVNASYLGKNGAVSYLFKVFSVCQRKHLSLLKHALGALGLLVKTSRCYVFTLVYICSGCVYICSHAYVHVCMRPSGVFVCACARACARARVHVCARACATCMCVPRIGYVHVYLHACIYVCAYCACNVCVPSCTCVVCACRWVLVNASWVDR